MNTMQQMNPLLGAMALAFALTSVPRVEAQEVEAWVVTIDALTTQPVVTDFVPASTAGSYVVLPQGAIHVFDDPNRYDLGWFGPSGQTRLQRTGQLVFGDMPYGALLGRFGANPWTFVGSSGAATVQPVDVGEAYEFALNMSGTDLAGLEGSCTVTILHVPDDSADVAQVAIRPDGPHVVATGLVANEGDQFVVLPYGTMRLPLAGHPFTDGWFRAEGQVDFQRAGQPLVDAPFGVVGGTFTGFAEDGFALGDGGCFAAQIVDYGDEFSVFANMTAADLASAEGRFLVNVLRVPAVGAAALPEAQGDTASRPVTFPNPTSGGTTLRFALDAPGSVRLRVADAGGRWVRTAFVGELAAGTHALDWDGRNDANELLPAGAYFYQLSTEAGSYTGRIVVAR